MKIKYLMPIILLTIGLCCNKELSESEKDRLNAIKKLEETHFECNGGNSEYSFEGAINKDSVCYHDKSGKYLMFNGLTSHTISGNTLSIGSNNNTGSYSISLTFTQLYDQDSNYTNIRIFSPHIKNSKNLIDVKSFIDSFYKVGYLPILDNKSSDFEKFKITLNILSPGKYNGHVALELTTSLGEQSDSYLKCTQLHRKEEFGKTYYDVTLDLNCNLYCYNYYTETPIDILQYGRLKGVFKTKLFL